MNLRNIAAILAIAATGTAFAATTETTVTRETPHGTVTKHIVKVQPNRHHRVAHNVVVHRAPLRHTRHVVYVNPHHHRVMHHARKVVVIHNS